MIRSAQGHIRLPTEELDPETAVSQPKTVVDRVRRAFRPTLGGSPSTNGNLVVDGSCDDDQSEPQVVMESFYADDGTLSPQQQKERKELVQVHAQWIKSQEFYRKTCARVMVCFMAMLTVVIAVGWYLTKDELALGRGIGSHQQSNASNSTAVPLAASPAALTHLYVDTKMDWFSAQGHCLSWGGRLATARTKEANLKLAALCEGDRCWLGMDDLVVEGLWRWHEGGDLDAGYTNWAPGAPDNDSWRGGGEDCGYVYGRHYTDTSKHSFWNDKDCRSRNPFICEQEGEHVQLCSASLSCGSQTQAPPAWGPSPPPRASRCTNFWSQAACQPAAPSFDSVPVCPGVVPRSQRRKGENTTTFAVIGDYGLHSAHCEGHVVALLEELSGRLGGWDFVLTTGDNNYWGGGCTSLQDNIGQYFGSYLGSTGSCDDKALPTTSPPLNSSGHRFYPTVGNHDWQGAGVGPHHPVPAYFQYFDHLRAFGPNASTVAAGYYQRVVAAGLVELFCLNSNLGNPAEANSHSELAAAQALWIEHALRASTARWKVVFFHHPPYSTAVHDDVATWMRLPYNEWGASIVLSGHQHVYERLEVEKLTYIINGLGGHPWVYEIHNCETKAEGSKVRYNAAHGAMVVQADDTSFRICFYSISSGGSLVDRHEIT